MTVASAELNRGKECDPLVAVEERMVLNQMRAQHRRFGGKVGIELFASESSGGSVQGGVSQGELRLQGNLVGRRASTASAMMRMSARSRYWTLTRQDVPARGGSARWFPASDFGTPCRRDVELPAP